MMSPAKHNNKLCHGQRYSAGLMGALVPITMHSSDVLPHQGAVRDFCTALQVSLSQVFAGMRQAQDQQLFTVLDWGVANAKLEEVQLSLGLHCKAHACMLHLF